AGNPSIEADITFLGESGVTDAYVHTAGPENRESSWTLLDHPRINAEPNAVVLVSQRGSDNPHPIGVQYVDERWSILNLDQTIIPDGAQFTVFIPAVEQTTVLTSNAPEVADSDPDALYQVTQHWDGVYNPRAVGLQVTGTGHAVFNQDDSPLLAGLKFNLAKGGSLVHHAALHNTNVNVSFIDHPAINGNPDALMLVSLNANPGGGGPLPNNSPLALEFDNSLTLWRIVNLTGGAILPGTSFNLRIASLGGDETRDFRQRGAIVADSALRGNGLARLFPTQLSRNPHPVGWRFDQVDWQLINRDSSPLSPNLDFNLLVAGVDSTAFTHVASGLNSKSSWTYLDHPALNAVPSAVIHVAAFGDAVPRPLGVWYDAGRSQWAIQDQLGQPIAHGAMFNVFVADNRVSAFTAGPQLDHPSLNGHPEAIVHVTPNWNPPGSNGVYNRHPIGLRYDGQRWTVVNTDGTALPEGAAFNVIVLDGGSVGGFSLAGQISYTGDQAGPVIVELSTGATDSGPAIRLQRHPARHGRPLCLPRYQRQW
ncbi:MAG: hypothetical protein ACI8W8_003415, partial [Rhodothermales bacterium]